jgi:hypothetical protein
MKTLSLVSILILLAVGPFAVASDLSTQGGMVSSGGNLLRNAHNPWWVKNTSEVRYCIEIDSKTFSATPEKIAMVVGKVLEYWKLEFTRKLQIVNGKDLINQAFNSMGVGVQTFTKMNCSGTEDLRFKFGYGTLSEKEASYLPDIRTHVGAAVRTEYDEASLKGKGFVYIASDSGPNSYDGGPSLIEQPWHYDIFLYLALAHELGHVFGIPHIGEVYSVMSETFLEVILNRAVAEPIKNLQIQGVTPTGFFFFPSSYFVHCSKMGFSSRAQNYFKLPAGTTCLQFGIDGPNKQIHIYATPGLTVVAGAYLGAIRDLDFEASYAVGVTLYLTEQQKVFDPMPGPFQHMMGPMFVGKSGSANFYPLTGPAKPLYVNLGLGRFDFVGMSGPSLKSVLKGMMEIIPHY